MCQVNNTGRILLTGRAIHQGDRKKKKRKDRKKSVKEKITAKKTNTKFRKTQKRECCSTCKSKHKLEQ